MKPAALPFVPQNVALHAVRISDGAILVHGPSGKPVNRIEAIQGELSADTLQGPFKFKGSAAMSGETRDFRLATLAADPSGAVHFKASMLGESTKNFYSIDGVISESSTNPKISGEVTGKLSLHRPQPAPREAKAGTDAKPDKDDVTAVFNLKSALAADAKGAKFDRPRTRTRRCCRTPDHHRLRRRPMGRGAALRYRAASQVARP